jgi:hypothetical protein
VDPSTFLSAGDLRHDLSAMEVDDVDSNTMTKTRPAPAWAVVPVCSQLGAEGRRLQAPNSALHGTGLSIAGSSERLRGHSMAPVTPYTAGVTGSAAFAGVLTTDLPGSPPRGAPV